MNLDGKGFPLGRLVIALVLVSGAALLVDFFAVWGGYTDKRLVLVLSVSCLIFLAFRINDFWLKAGFCLWGAGIGVGLFLSEWTTPSVAEAGMFFFFPIAVTGLAGWILKYGIRGARLAVALVLLVMMAYAALTPSIYLFALADGVQSLDDYLPWGFVNIRYWGHAATWLLPLLPLAHVVYKGRFRQVWKLFVVLSAGIWWWLVFLSAARGTLLSITIAVIFLWIVFGRSLVPWFRLFAAQAGIGVLAWLLLSVLIPHLLFDTAEMRSVGTDTSGRMRLWAEAWLMSLENFPFGMGVQSWLTHTPITESYEMGKKLGHPHNMYLMWAAEFGWLAVTGLIVIGLRVFSTLMRARKAVKHYTIDYEESMMVIALTGSVGAAMIHAGASAVFMAPSSMLLGLVVLALFWAVMWQSVLSMDHQQYRVIKREWRYVWCLVPLVLLWNYSTYIYYWEMKQDQAFYAEKIEEGTLPRFWFHGNFPRPPEKMMNNRE